MEDSKSLDHYDVNPDESINKEVIEIKDKKLKSTSNIKNELNENNNSKINPNENSFHKGNSKILEDNKKVDSTSELPHTFLQRLFHFLFPHCG